MTDPESTDSPVDGDETANKPDMIETKPTAPTRRKPYRGYMRRLRWPIAVVVAVSTALVGLIPAVQAINELVFIPASLPVTLALDVELAPVPGTVTNDGMSDLIGLDATIHSTNFGSRNVAVLAAWFELRGYDVEPGASDAETVVDDSMAWCGPHISGRYGREAAKSTMIETGRILDDWSFEPGEGADTQRLFLVRPTDFDFVRLTVNVTLVKGSSVERTDASNIEWSTSPFGEDTSAYCVSDLDGNVDEPALYQTAWRARDPGLVPWDSDIDAIAVQWRPTLPVYHIWNGTDPCDPTLPGASCDISIKVGGRGPDEYAWPYIVVCERDESALRGCRSIDVLADDQSRTVRDKYGITVTSSSVDFPLWSIGQQAP